MPAADGAPPTWVIDLDGVVWLAEQPIAGSSAAVARLRAAGIRVLFATNNSAPTLRELVTRLGQAGIAAGPDDLVTSGQAAAGLLPPGSTAYVCGEGGLLEALGERGVHVADAGPVDAVVVGWNRNFDFDVLATTVALVRDGARFVATNEDATFPTPDRLLPGAGALLAAVSTGAQATPEVAGKPHEPMAALIRQRADGRAVLMVGDRPATDGVLAQRLGIPYALVRSGVTRDGREPMEVTPDEDAADLADLVEHKLGR